MVVLIIKDLLLALRGLAFVIGEHSSPLTQLALIVNNLSSVYTEAGQI